MGRVVSPSKSEIRSLRTPLQPGEQRVLDIFEKCLSDDWEIYTQPHLNGCRPDFVLLNPNIGMAVFEVKDWDLNAMEYSIRVDNKNGPELVAKKDGRTFKLQNPLKQLRRYRREIHALYCPRLNSRGGFATITAGLIFPFSPLAELEKLLSPLKGQDALFPQYSPISGAESIGAEDIKQIFPESKRRSSSYMREELAIGL